MRFRVCLPFGHEIKENQVSITDVCPLAFLGRDASRAHLAMIGSCLSLTEATLPFPVEVEWTRLFIFTDTVDGFETASVRSVQGTQMSCLAISPESTVSVVIVLYSGEH